MSAPAAAAAPTARDLYDRLAENASAYGDSRRDRATFDRIARATWDEIETAGKSDDVLSIWRAENPF